ncbi:hypothetical protein ACIPY6_28560 [Streptomyces sp. NPDC090054]|uniref:hypothetical protein n=1 Tax=Streptomyces sp. NPDC090054 TaxID=3365933 RepID=UPI003817F032
MTVEAISQDEACCVCGTGPIAARNFRCEPLCQACAACRCGQTPCIRTPAPPASDPSLRERALDAVKQVLNADGYWLPADAQEAAVGAVLDVTTVAQGEAGYALAALRETHDRLWSEFGLERDRAEKAEAELDAARRRAMAIQTRLDAAREWARRNLPAERQTGLLMVLRGYAPDAKCRRCQCPAGNPQCDHCNNCDVPDQPKETP